ncbi:hypothetical protein [Clostridium sp.]|uniref:hypothetical protein n=1 Tax=Clostridium sp. TaxID=1506 RepID=UPI003217C39B
MDWEEVKKQYKGVDRALLLVNDYMELGNYKKIGEKYNTTWEKVCATVNSNKKTLEEFYPEIYKRYTKISFSNKGKVDGVHNCKNYVTKNSKNRKAWEKIKVKYTGADRALFIIRESLKAGQVKEVADRYNMPVASLVKIITMHKEELLKDHYEEYMQYKEQCRRRQGERVVRIKRYTEKIFKDMPQSMYEEDFLNFIIQYNTGERSSMDMIKIAKKNGVRVYDYTVEGNKKFVV